MNYQKKTPRNLISYVKGDVNRLKSTKEDLNRALSIEVVNRTHDPVMPLILDSILINGLIGLTLHYRVAGV